MEEKVVLPTRFKNLTDKGKVQSQVFETVGVEYFGERLSDFVNVEFHIVGRRSISLLQNQCQSTAEYTR
jgi:hypothetical protein